MNLIFPDPPNWDEDGDGVLDNYNDYENNGSLTSKVYVDDLDYSTPGDMVAAFVNGEQRGVAIASGPIPFGPYNLCPDIDKASIPMACTSISNLPTACAASVCKKELYFLQS